MSGRLILAGCGAVIALAAALQLAGTLAPASRVEQLQAAPSEQASPAYPPAMGGPDIVQPAITTAAESRNRIVDSDDLYAVVSRITTHSPTIEKLAASEALMACADFRPKGRREPAEQAAAQQLLVRCARIRQDMRRNGALDKAIELRTSAEGDSSPLGRLAALSQRSDTGSARWHADDFALVSDALRSSDSVLIGEAIRALHAQLDGGLPDSKLRMQAFAHAANSYTLLRGDQRTVFDALVDCANLGRCTNHSGRARAEHDIAPVGAREQSEIQRLVEQYRLALQRGTSAAELLAIR
jgi:hypothetical protein